MVLMACMVKVLEFISWIIIGAVVLLVGLAVIGCCVAWRDDE